MAPAPTLALVLLLHGVSASGQSPPSPRDVSLTAADGTPLQATYYAAAKPGPAVLLLHMCNTTRKSWMPLAPQLAAAGIHTLTMDYRGFGESGGARHDAMPPQDAQKIVGDKWPGDIDAAYALLLAQPGIDRTRIGVGGGSCGVTQAVHFAQRHPEVRSLVLLAGPLDPAGLTFLEQTIWLPIFAAAAADDQYDGNASELMQWILAISGNPRNTFSGFKDGKHGTEIFGPHPELPKQIVVWYADTLVKALADPKATVTPKSTPLRKFWQQAEAPDGVSAAVKMFHDARTRDPHVMLFPEPALNLLGYQHLQAGRTKEAIELFKLNTQAYPTSANTYDSLGDAYLADGQNDLALQASQKAIEMLAGDKAPDDFKKAIRASAEQKIAKLKGSEKK
jgi:pimeloyl-ACP methyl ester carboxylesterase